ncbi:MAG: ABC transporter ATP-binding protein [Syntrophorhabdaceae bacterium]|nr:ABC transporter ATP-binding protein [Syntrophorhabdaceae bacterium]
MSEIAISFQNVTKTYPLYHHFKGGIKNLLFHPLEGIKSLKSSQFMAIRDISFEVKKGESFGIIGKNGAGKSTILGLIAGVIKPSKGKIMVNGGVSPLLELGAGFHPDLTGRENIILKGILLGLTRSEILNKIKKIIDFSELEEFIEQPIRTYSSGMLARLGFSIVANIDPEILLIDEILAVGDKNFQDKCLKRMLDFKEQKVTIVFVSHSMDYIDMLCNRVMWLDDHSIKNIGKPELIIKQYQQGNIS